MSGIYGLLGLEDGDISFINRIGADRVYDAASEYLRAVDAEMMKAYGVFVEEETELYSERYKLPGGGRMQKRGQFASNAAVKPHGGWDVAYALDDFEEPVAEDDVTIAYTTVRDVQLALDTIEIRNINAMRFEILWRLFNNANRTVPAWNKIPALTVKPLANGDSDLYPPVIGVESEATENHYVETNYAVASISDTNNPLETARQDLEEHFGTPQGFGNVAFFGGTTVTTKIANTLTDFDPVDDSHKMSGANRDQVTGEFPNVPGRIIGRSNGVWVVEWAWIPANYGVSIDLDAPAPLKVRRDPASTGLRRGLHLAGESNVHPLHARHWRNRYGVGVANRLNGVIQEFGTGGTYSIPAPYA